MNTNKLAAKIRAHLDGVIAAAGAAAKEPWQAFKACGSICVGGSREVTCIEDIENSLHIEILGGEDTEQVAKFLVTARTVTPQMARALLGVLEIARNLDNSKFPIEWEASRALVAQVAHSLEILEATDEQN